MHLAKRLDASLALYLVIIVSSFLQCGEWGGTRIQFVRNRQKATIVFCAFGPLPPGIAKLRCKSADSQFLDSHTLGSHSQPLCKR